MDFKYLDRYIKLGLNVAYYRKLRNMTQSTLAEEINGEVTHISKIERGLVGLSLDKLFDIADVLKISPDKLLDL